MTGPAINPLTDEHCHCLDAILKAEPDVRDLIKRCQDCGIDLGGRDQQYENIVDRARRIKATFFPDRN